MSSNTGNTLLALLTGAAIGAGIGILYAPEKGDVTRKKIQKNAKIGKKCKISSHSFVCEGVSIEDRVFVGHGVMFINDIYPQAANEYGDLQSEDDWQIIETFVREGASIGSNATIMAGIKINRLILKILGIVLRSLNEILSDCPIFTPVFL